MDYDGELTKESIVQVMLREYSRPSVQELKSVKQAERFLHLDTWSAQHSDEEKPPRVVGFFPSNQTAGYAVFRSTAQKLQVQANAPSAHANAPRPELAALTLWRRE